MHFTIEVNNQIYTSKSYDEETFKLVKQAICHRRGDLPYFSFENIHGEVMVLGQYLLDRAIFKFKEGGY